MNPEPTGRRAARPIDDYRIVRGTEWVGPPFGAQLFRVLTGALLIVLAAISVALLWVVGVLLNLF